MCSKPFCLGNPGAWSGAAARVTATWTRVIANFEAQRVSSSNETTAACFTTAPALLIHADSDILLEARHSNREMVDPSYS